MEMGEPISATFPPASECVAPKYALVAIAEVVKVGGADQEQPAIGRRQYVNLDENTEPTQPHPDYGRFIRLKARVICTGSGASPAAQTVYWSYTSAGTNRAGLPAAEKEGFDSAGGPATTTATTDASGWTQPVKFFLSQYGGDRFDIVASLTPSSGTGGERTVAGYETWRRLFYDIVEMKTKDGVGKYELPNAIQTKVRAGYADVFIDLQDTGKRALGDYRDNFDEVEKAFKWADGYCTADGVPLKLHISVVDQTLPFAGRYGASQKFVEADADAVRFTSSSKIRPYDFSGHTWLVKKEYFDGSVWRPLNADVTLDGTRGARKFIIDFGTATVANPLAPLAPSPAKKIKVRITYMEPGSYGGWGGSNSLHLIICRGTYEDLMSSAQADQQIVVACIHEPGHAMGLVQAAQAWHSAAHAAHCTYSDCTMWYASSPGNERFHPETKSDPGCRTFLRQKILDKNAMQTSWKFPR